MMALPFFLSLDDVPLSLSLKDTHDDLSWSIIGLNIIIVIPHVISIVALSTTQSYADLLFEFHIVL